jgi:hypothetical protein
MVEHRRQGAGDFFGKGLRTPSSTSAHIYWGVPFIWVNEDDQGDTQIDVQSLPQFQLYQINEEPYNTARYYDTDGDGLNDWEDLDIDGDGIPNGDDDDADGNGVNDDTENDNSGLFDDADGDGIPNWKDDQTGNRPRPSIEMVMDYEENYRQMQARSEDSSQVANTFQTQISDKVFINFYDRNGVVEAADTPIATEKHQQNLSRQAGQWVYKEVSPGTTSTVQRTITWTDSK